MAAAKKSKRAAAPVERPKLTKRWMTSDEDLELALVMEPGDMVLSAEDVGTGTSIELAVEPEQIDELMKMLASAKDACARYNRGEKIASDPDPEEEEEEEELDEEEVEEGADDLDDEEEELDEEEEDLDDE